MPYAQIHTRHVEVVPEFTAEVASHIEAYDEVLPHVLFGEFTQFVLAAYARNDDELVARCLSLLEDALGQGDPMVRNLVQVSFVENVGPFLAAQRPFIQEWPPLLLQEAKRQLDWKPGDPGPAALG